MTLMTAALIADDHVAPSLPTFDARALTGENGLAQIVLGEKVYTLRITKAEKLILTK